MKGMNLLGYKAKDKVTGFEGVVESVAYDLYGCVQVALRPTIDEKSKAEDKLPPGHWFDLSRLTVTNRKRVMDPPDFRVTSEPVTPTTAPGPADKSNWARS